MNKIIKDELNIKDIMKHIDYENILYVQESNSDIIKVPYNNENILDIGNIGTLNIMNNDYIVLSLTKRDEENIRYLVLKRINFK